jgi:hypothetical protein
MENKIKIKSTLRVIFLLLSFWFIGLLISFWYGLGWFFLSETLRRILMAIPQTYIKFLRVFVSDERAEEEKLLISQKNARLMYVWRFIVACIWVILTIFVFLKINIRLVSFFT